MTVVYDELVESTFKSVVFFCCCYSRRDIVFPEVDQDPVETTTCISSRFLVEVPFDLAAFCCIRWNTLPIVELFLLAFSTCRTSGHLFRIDCLRLW